MSNCTEGPASPGRQGRLLDRLGPSLYNARRRANLRFAAGAQVAQLVEHVTENHGVGGSIPPLGTMILSYKSEV
jgi:hypothetical protein